MKPNMTSIANSMQKPKGQGQLRARQMEKRIKNLEWQNHKLELEIGQLLAILKANGL